MRRLIPAAIAIALAFAPAGCKRKPPQVETIEDGNKPALSSVHAASPRAEAQLLSGFYDLEGNSWRWTMRRFSLVLQPPPDAARKGAQLELKFDMAEPVIERRGAVTLSLSVEGQALAPETYTKPGEYTCVRDVPASAFSAETAKVDFALDKYLAAGEIETRELGLVFKSAALLAK
jgi:hypothetical protein